MRHQTEKSAPNRLTRYMTPCRRIVFSITIVCMLFLGLYREGAGKMLYSDDFHRINDNLVLNSHYFRTLFTDTRSDSFYRPINHLSFGITHHFFGLDARVYGATNLALGIGCIAFGFLFLRRFLESDCLALCTVWGWLLAYKPFVTATTWAVGRTTLLYVLFLVIALVTLQYNIRGRLVFVPLLYLLSLMSKESAVVGLAILPLFSRDPPKLVFAQLSGLIICLCFYMYLRAQAGGIGQSDAPVYYQYNYSVTYAITRGLEYIERLLPGLAASVIALPFALHPRNRVEPVRWATACLLAFVAAVCISPMLLIPSRSGLYAICPGIFLAASIATIHKGARSHKAIITALCVATAIVFPISCNLQRKAVERNGIVYRTVLGIQTPMDKQTPMSQQQARDLVVARGIIEAIPKSGSK